MTSYGKGWAWMCDFGLCHWAKPSIDRLLSGGKEKPSPEAKPVHVAIVLMTEFNKMRRENKLLRHNAKQSRQYFSEDKEDDK